MSTYNYFAAPGIIEVPKYIDFEKIVRCVCTYYNVTEEDLKQRCRKRYLAEPRFMIFFLSKDTPLTLEEIGKRFKRDHATVVYARKSLTGLYEVDMNIKRAVTKINEMLNN